MIRAIVAIVLVAVVGGPPSHEASADFGRAGYVQAAPLLYVCIQDDAKVAVVDMAKAAVVRTIDLQKLGFPATAKPHYIVVEPDGSNWYVSLIGANKVVKFDAQDRVAASFDMETPGMLSFAAGAKLVLEALETAPRRSRYALESVARQLPGLGGVLVKRLEKGGVLWVVTAMRKVAIPFALQTGSLYGSVKRVREQVAELRDVGVRHLLCQTGFGSMDHAQNMASMRRFGEQVMPAFRD